MTSDASSRGVSRASPYLLTACTCCRIDGANIRNDLILLHLQKAEEKDEFLTVSDPRLPENNDMSR